MTIENGAKKTRENLGKSILSRARVFTMMEVSKIRAEEALRQEKRQAKITAREKAKENATGQAASFDVEKAKETSEAMESTGWEDFVTIFSI